MIVVGLTGGIASGKSTVAGMFAKEGATVLDGDEVVRELQGPGTKVYEAIVEAFGPDILQPDGTINRKLLGEVVFRDEELRRRLEAIVHPALVVAVEERLAQLRAQGIAVCVVELPLLIESGAEGRFDWVVVVTAPEEVQVRRLMADRALSREEAVARIHTQMPLAEKVRRADFVIESGGDLGETGRRVQELHKEILRVGPKKT